MAALDLTGYWRANDGTFYYLRQEHDGTLWWVGLSDDGGLQPGLVFTNVFHGQVNDELLTIDGMWADVPRGATSNHGMLSLIIDFGLHGTSIELTKVSESVGFGASTWSPITIPPSPFQGAHLDIQEIFKTVTRGGSGNPLWDDLKPYKDHVVLFGNVILTPNDAYLPVHVNPPGPGSSYADFVCNGDNDGDMVLDIQVDGAQLDIQADFNFWTEGWEAAIDLDPIDPNVIREKLAHGRYGIKNYLALELVMFGRTAPCGDTEHYDDPPLLPGWQEEVGGNSVLLNGRPISGDVVAVTPLNRVKFIGGKQIVEGTRLRVTGPLILDCGHGRLGDPCGRDEPDLQNQEIHPVYALDIIDTMPSDDLSGTWADDLGRTYYVRQLDDNTLWWLGMSPFRDITFARVFQGTIQDQTIVGRWADVLAAGENSGSVGSMTLQIDPGRMSLHLFDDQGVELLPWTKLYHAFPPPPHTMWHTIRHADSKWQRPFSDVETQTSDPGLFSAVGCATDSNGNLHVCGTTNDGRMWHTIRHVDGSWQPFFDDVKSVTSDPGLFSALGCATDSNGNLHVCGITTDGGMWHTIRHVDSSWQPFFGDVKSVTSDPGPFSALGCATDSNGNLHVCGTTRDGGMWHTIRDANGNWLQSFGNVKSKTSDPGPFSAVSCATDSNGNLHVCGVIIVDGGMWHTIRGASGDWLQPFRDVKSKTSDPGLFSAVGCAVDSNDSLHVCGITIVDGGIWHTIRGASGGWLQPFRDVRRVASDPGALSKVGCASFSGELHLCATSQFTI